MNAITLDQAALISKARARAEVNSVLYRSKCPEIAARESGKAIAFLAILDLIKFGDERMLQTEVTGRIDARE